MAFRVDSKVLLMALQVQVSDLLQAYLSSRSLASNVLMLSVVLKSRLVLRGDRTFPAVAPKL